MQINNFIVIEQNRHHFLHSSLSQGGGGTSLQEANGDVPLDGVAFLRLEWLEWGRTFSDFGVSIGIQNGKILG